MKTAAQIIGQYLTENRMMQKTFCANCKISRASLYKYFKGLPIHPLKARMIENGTGGQIKASDLLLKN